jgi:serine/threonine protein kinase
MYDYVTSSNGFPESYTRFFFKQLVSALKHIHKSFYCNRDLKLQNIMVDNEYNLRIIDFGFAAKLNGKLLDENLGSKYYYPHEIYFNKLYKGDKADIFSLGCILFIMRTGLPIFDYPSKKTYKLCRIDSDYFWDYVKKSCPISP